MTIPEVDAGMANFLPCSAASMPLAPPFAAAAATAA
eukprot:CAMPEP_0204150940 /NCGR_PEP_ID=MMETSP0361-20130328/25721_1 /ASSEMBLY_ACC=CAM_ASM_000343 /TAXON_ID=268821 /ORGANISM="Scrippsiella Hangoei, Strain SHTV-5" /LENGTH=35 /DNA_ID= /DNA_START= /DNA_END= /DNA_ORIENTATION=